MKLRLTLHAALATLLMAAALWLMPQAQAVTISSTVTANSALPTTVSNTLDLQNGGFQILANPAAGLGHVTGDGVDETTLWSFNFNGNPQLAAFMAEGGVSQAILSITLHSKFFVDGIGPPGAITGPADNVSGIFPRWNLSGAMSGTFGVYSRQTFTTDLVGVVGLNASEVYSWLGSHNGSFPMIFADDAIVSESTLTLVSAPVPEPGSALTLAAGLAVLAGLMRRRLHTATAVR